MKSDVSQIFSAIGEDRLVSMGISKRNQRKFLGQGAISAKFFRIIEKDCVEVGVPCPRSAFTFVNPDDTNGGNAAAVQGSAE